MHDRTRLVSPAFGRQIFFWNPLYFGLKATQNIDLRTLGYVNNLVVASNVIPAARGHRDPIQRPGVVFFLRPLLAD